MRTGSQRQPHKLPGRRLAWAAQQRDRGFAEPVSRTLHCRTPAPSHSFSPQPSVRGRGSNVPTLPRSPGQPHARALVLSTLRDFRKHEQRELVVLLHTLKTPSLRPAGPRRGDGLPRGPVFLFLNSQRVPLYWGWEDTIHLSLYGKWFKHW